MGHDWVIHVLSDLRQFAQQNELPLLRAQLDDAMMTAVVEIAARHDAPVQWSAPPPQGGALND